MVSGVAEGREGGVVVRRAGSRGRLYRSTRAATTSACYNVGMAEILVPEDPLMRFQDLYTALNADRSWFQSADPLRFAAIAAMCIPGQAGEVAKSIRQIGDRIKAESGMFGAMRSDLRFIVAAILLSRGDTADGLMGEVRRVRALFRARSMRRAEAYETMAILMLRMKADQAPVSDDALDRFKAMYEEMKLHHWWLTGPEDFPACAILSGQDADIDEIGARTEAIYQALITVGFAAGDPLQTAANLLYLASGQPHDIAQRYHALAEGFKLAGVSIWRSDYDELAILSFLHHSAQQIIETVLARRAVIEALKPKPSRELTFNLASSVAFLELVKVDEQMHTITDARALMDIQAIIQAQQAAAAAGAAAAASAASAGGS